MLMNTQLQGVIGKGGMRGSKRKWSAFVMTLFRGKEGHQEGRSGGWGAGGVQRGSNEGGTTIHHVRCLVKTLDGSFLST